MTKNEKNTSFYTQNIARLNKQTNQIQARHIAQFKPTNQI